MSLSNESSPKRPWRQIVAEVQSHRDDSLRAVLHPKPPDNDLPRNVMGVPNALLDSSVVSITQMVPEKLLESLASGKLSAVDVTTAYLKRAALSQALTNCITELLPGNAMSRAIELDKYFSKHKRPIGPLHGLPISVKEHIGFEGRRCTTGYVSHWDTYAKEDAHILQVLRDAGAVFHARTTVPQTMMHLETDSNLYGVTTNPHNHDLTAGGSSGGEGALIALRGSPLGIGSDVGGSIRNPAANCGIYGLRPTAFRIPTDGWGYMMAGADLVESVLGPMSTSLQGLKIFMKTIIDSEPWHTEPALIPMPWRPYTVPKDRPLRFGILWHDGIVRPHPPITNALKKMEFELKFHGFETVDFEPLLHDHAWTIISSLYYPDGGKADADDINSSGEPWLPLSKWIIEDNPNVKDLSVGELAYWLEEREVYRKEYARHWNKYGIDVLLCPAGPGVAPKHNTAKYWNYTSQWNLLDYPSVAFPVDKVDEYRDRWWSRKEEMLSGLDEDNFKLWDVEEFSEMPIGLQLVGRRFEDEKILGILEHINQDCFLDLPRGVYP